MSAPLLLVLFLFSGALAQNSPTLDDVARRFVRTKALLNNLLDEVKSFQSPFGDGAVNVSQIVLRLLDNHMVEDSVFVENVVAMPSNDNTSCVKDPFCSHYEFELKPKRKSLSSIHIWLMKLTPDDTLDMSVCWLTAAEEDQTCEHMQNVSEVKSVLGWGIYQLPSRLVLEYRREQLLCTVKILGTSAEDNAHYDHQPFLVASLNPSPDRKRRSAASTGNCSLTDFYVSFKQIGWYWVVAPLGFNANMCVGKCSNQINAYPSHHHQVLGTILNNRSSMTGQSSQDLWTPCCSATRLSPLDMIYVVGNNTHSNSSTHSLVYHKIKNMVTESCGCW